MSLHPPTLLLVDDDVIFCEVLARALAQRSFRVVTAHNATAALEQARREAPTYAVVDLKMPGESGLRVVAGLKTLLPDMQVVMLTGFASIATAVEAIKLGAVHYIAKPASVDEIVLGLSGGGPVQPEDPTPPSLDRLEWEHIQRVLTAHEGNISATARALNMHRRTLQRKLGKSPKKV